MKFIPVYLLILHCLLTCNPAFAKKNTDFYRAEYYFHHFDYHQALPLYIKYINEEGGFQQDLKTCARIGDCFRLTGNFDSAAKWYAIAVTNPTADDIVKLNYGKVLMTLMKYSEAGKWLREYQKHKNDRRVDSLIR